MRQIALAMVATTFAAGLSFIEPANAENPFQPQIETVVTRLALTEEQEAVARPIFQEGFRERMAILQEAGIQPGEKPKLHQMMRIRSPMQASQAKTEERLSAVLSQSQMAEYKIILEEIRRQMRAQFQ